MKAKTYSSQRRAVERAARAAAAAAFRDVFERVLKEAQAQGMNGTGILTLAAIARREYLRALPPDPRRPRS